MKNNGKSSKVQFSLFDFLNVFQKENSWKLYTFRYWCRVANRNAFAR